MLDLYDDKQKQTYTNFSSSAIHDLQSDHFAMYCTPSFIWWFFRLTFRFAHQFPLQQPRYGSMEFQQRCTKCQRIIRIRIYSQQKARIRIFFRLMGAWAVLFVPVLLQPAFLQSITTLIPSLLPIFHLLNYYPLQAVATLLPWSYAIILLVDYKLLLFILNLMRPSQISISRRHRVVLFTRQTDILRPLFTIIQPVLLIGSMVLLPTSWWWLPWQATVLRVFIEPTRRGSEK